MSILKRRLALHAEIIRWVWSNTFGKATTSLRRSALVTSRLQVVMLNYSKSYENRLIRCGHSLESFLSVKTGNSGRIRKTDTGCTGELIYIYFTSQILEAEELVRVTSGTEGRERDMCTLHQSLRMVLVGLESICTAKLHVRSKSNRVLSCSSIRASYCCDFREDRIVTRIRHELSVRRSYVRFLSTIGDIGQERSMKVRAMIDTC